MHIVVAFPPNYESLSKTFPLNGQEIFAWGETIYNPSRSAVSVPLLAHEAIHCKQQGGDVQGWWDRYLVDKAWRLEQELEAHRAEYRAYCVVEKDRNYRARYLDCIASRLAAPMYGGVIGRREAALRISARVSRS